MDVIMPVSDPTNPTILGRFDTYTKEFKEEFKYENAASLAEETKRNKLELLKNGRNTLIEHNILCMWRVVILSEYCIVQTYFPNHAGVESNNAPIFVFKKNAAVGYYATFDLMFDLLVKYASIPPTTGGSDGSGGAAVEI